MRGKSTTDFCKIALALACVIALVGCVGVESREYPFEVEEIHPGILEGYLAKEEIPDRYRPYLGTYLFAPLQAEFKVFYKDAGLAVDDPLSKKVVGLQEPDERGRRMDEFDKNAILFEQDGDSVSAMIIESINRFRRDED